MNLHGSIGSQVIGIGKPYHEVEADRTAASIYAKPEHTDEDFDLLLTINRDLPHEREAAQEKDPAKRELLLSAARSIRIASRERRQARKADRAQQAYAATQEHVTGFAAPVDGKQAIVPVPPLTEAERTAMRDDCFAVILGDGASDADKLNARATLWEHGIGWPEHDRLRHADGYTATEIRQQIESYRALIAAMIGKDSAALAR